MQVWHLTGLRVRVWQVRQGRSSLMECGCFPLVVGEAALLLRVTFELGDDSVDEFLGGAGTWVAGDLPERLLDFFEVVFAAHVGPRVE